MLVRTGMYHFEVSCTALYRVRYVLARTSTYPLELPCTRCTGFQMSGTLPDFDIEVMDFKFKFEIEA
jgi:hypothetical protein